MNKYSYIALILAVLVGLLVGGFFMNNKASKELNKIKEEHKQELYRQIKNSQDSIKSINKIINNQDSILQDNKLVIERLGNKIKSKEYIIIKQREEAKRFTKSEKTQWINNRYDSIQSNGDSIAVSEPIIGKIIDELIQKDGLVDKVQSLDSIITVYHVSDSLYKQQRKEFNEKENMYKRDMNRQSELISLTTDEVVKLKKQLRKEKLKKNIGKIGTIVGAVAIIGLLL